jgi:uncharacterized protein
VSAATIKSAAARADIVDIVGPTLPWGFFVRLDQPYVASLSSHGEPQIYVSRGTGYWGPPMRVGAPPGITLLELEGAGATTAVV